MNAARVACRVELATMPWLESEIGAAPRWMSEDEAQRALGFAAALRRRQYLASRWLAKRMAAQAMGGSARDWRVLERDDGRRVIRSDNAEYFVSLSHCGDHLACAIADQPIGVDLELPRKPRDYEALAREVFAPEECERLHRAAAAARAELFFLHWTLKEAQGKRAGEGLRPERARHFVAQPCEADAADAMTWPVQQGSLALAAWPGAEIEVSGLDPLPPPSYWRFVASA